MREWRGDIPTMRDDELWLHARVSKEHKCPCVEPDLCYCCKCLKEWRRSKRSAKMSYSEKIREQRQRWMNDELARMYHTYDRLMKKFGQRKDEGKWDIVRRAIPRLRHLERAIKTEEKKCFEATMQRLREMED